MKRREFLKGMVVAGVIVGTGCISTVIAKHVKDVTVAGLDGGCIDWVVARADVPYKNNHVYPKNILERVVENFKPGIGAIGQTGMEGNRLDKVSHIVEGMRMDGDNLVANIKILDTPYGKLLQTMLKHGTMVFRTSGAGSIDLIDGHYVIQDDYELISVNAVLKTEAA